MENNRAKGGFKRVAVNLLVTLVFGLVYFYFELPAINLHEKDFYGFFFLMSAVYCVTALITSGIYKFTQQGAFFKSIRQTCLLPFVLCVAPLEHSLFGRVLYNGALGAPAYTEVAISSPTCRRSPTTASPCWTPLRQPVWATASWAS